MKRYRFNVRVIHNEIWEVEAKTLLEAAEKVKELDDDVETDETGGEVTDWEIIGNGREISNI